MPRPPLSTKPIYFGQFLVTPHVFHLTAHSFALVNLKPLLPGHILVSPLRRVPRIHDLTPAELTDLFSAVQRLSRTLTRLYDAAAFNIAVQDGWEAGQSVAHVHVHVIPRRKGDLPPDALYGMLEGPRGDVGVNLLQAGKEEGVERQRVKFPRVEEAARNERSEEEMRAEAEWLREETEKDIREEERREGRGGEKAGL